MATASDGVGAARARLQRRVLVRMDGQANLGMAVLVAIAVRGRIRLHGDRDVQVLLALVRCRLRKVVGYTLPSLEHGLGLIFSALLGLLAAVELCLTNADIFLDLGAS